MNATAMAERRQSRSRNRQPRSGGRLTLIIQKGNPKVKKGTQERERKGRRRRERKAARMGWEETGGNDANGYGVETVCPPAGERRRKGKEKEDGKEKGVEGLAGGSQRVIGANPR